MPTDDDTIRGVAEELTTGHRKYTEVRKQLACYLEPNDPGALVRQLSIIYERIVTYGGEVQAKRKLRGKERGRFKHPHELSYRLLRSFRQREQVGDEEQVEDEEKKGPFETVLERLAAYLLKGYGAGEWGNQINLASGFLRWGKQSRAAVDLGWRSESSYQYKELCLYEIKAWDSAEDVMSANLQLFLYFCLFCSQSLIHAARFPALASMTRLTLRVVAPSTYFEKQGCDPEVDPFRQAFTLFSTGRPEFKTLRLDFGWRALRGYDINAFYDAFDHVEIANRIANSKDAANAGEILKPEAVDPLRRWILQAVTEA